VTVENSSIGGDLAGGDIDNSASGTATGNTVTLIGKVDLSGSLYGGSGTSCTDCLTGNALIIRPDQAAISGGSSTGYGINVSGNLQNFESFHFDLPNTIVSGDVIVNVTGTATAARVGQLDIADGGTPLLSGDTLVLVRAGTLSDAATPVDGSTVTGRQGMLLKQTWRLDVNGTNPNDFTATVQSTEASEESKSLVEGVLGATAQLLDGADLVSDQGIGLAVASASAVGGDVGGASFGTISVGNTRYNTGSHVDTKGWSLIVGASTGVKVAPGTLTLGGFFQYGHGSYDSVNSFTTGKVKGSGDTTSYGIGGLARLDFDSGYFLETSLRVGKVDSDYKGNIGASYDIKAEYHGLHLGAGKRLQLSPANQLELYGRYAWTRQDGDTVKIDATKRLKIKAVDSLRGRLGARVFHNLDKRFALYGGLSVEREFDGKANASMADGMADDLRLDSPKMKGNSRIVEFGMKIAPTKSLPWSTAIGIQGYGGKREGAPPARCSTTASEETGRPENAKGEPLRVFFRLLSTGQRDWVVQTHPAPIRGALRAPGTPLNG
jgi:outer membrane autotransporter protein